MKPKVITLCGSTRFFPFFQVLNAEITKRGHCVFSVAICKEDTQGEMAKELKHRLDMVHLMKIIHSDMIVVIDVAGYVGESTTREIEVAKRRKLPVIYLSKFGPMPEAIGKLVDHISPGGDPVLFDLWEEPKHVNTNQLR